ncbi:MAG: 2Fe-2S iron-sulfur cluster-binding protein [Limosilactobacillus sp.]
MTKQRINGFQELAQVRAAKIAEASDQPIPKTYPMNELVKALHPETQYLKIAKIIDHGPDAKSFVFVPDTAKGTKRLAYFQAGQYISLRMHIGDSYVTRPYAIRSTPKQAVEGQYILTIKLVPNGFATPYIWQNWKVGTTVAASGPAGELFYEPLRDAKTIVAIAGGSGITPFYSLAGAILDGTVDANLIILYGSRRHDNILLNDELSAIAKQTARVKIVNVLSDEEVSGYEHGFITKKLIEKYAPSDYSIFISGPSTMYQFVMKEIQQLHLSSGRVRHELNGNTATPYDAPNYPLAAKGKTFKLTVTTRDQTQTIPARADESLLIALERAGIIAPSLCRSGICSACRSRVISGHAFTPASLDHRRSADKEFGYVNTCVAYPVSDLSLEVPVHDYANQFG